MKAQVGSEALTLAVFQPLAEPEPAGRPAAEAVAARLARLEAEAQGAAREGAHLLVCPELYLAGYGVGDALIDRAEPQDGPSLARLAEIAAASGVALLVGYPERVEGRHEGRLEGRLYNAAVAFGPDGRRLAHMRKLTRASDYERGYFAPGAGLGFFEIRGWRVAVAICYDLEFPETARAAALSGAAVFAAPTALGAEWGVVAERLVPTRAFENGLFVAYANYAGRERANAYFGGSRIVGPDGESRAEAGDAGALIVARLEPEAIGSARARLPYLVDRAEVLARLTPSGEE